MESMQAAQAGEADSICGAEGADGGQPAILVIDDEAETLAAAELTLRSFGFDHVLTAQDGTVALETVARKNVGAVLMDFTMPGLAGLELLKALVERWPELPVVVVTAIDDVDTAIQCMKDGAVSYLIKPVRPEDYIREARNSLEMHRMRRQQARCERQARRMEALGRLATGIVHDFNNLLQIVTASCDMVANDPGNSERTKCHMVRANHAAHSASASALRLLAFARGSNTSPRAVDLVQELERFAEFLRPLTGADIEVALEIPPGPRLADVSRDDLQQALLNLCFNALDAMPQGGRLTLRCTTEAPEPGMQVIDRRGPGKVVALEVRDTGCGMDAATLSRVLDMFSSRGSSRRTGTGFGLTIVQDVVRRANGSLNVSTAPGQGSVFRMEFAESA